MIQRRQFGANQKQRVQSLEAAQKKAMKATADITGNLNPTEWLDKHGDYLYRYALVRVRDSGIAEDLLQETLLAAIGAAESHEGRSSERTWLAGIMKHKVFDYFRRTARTPELQMAGNEEHGELDLFEKTGIWQGHWREDQAPVNWPVDAIKLLESREFWETLNRCLSRLPRQMAIAFTLREIDGMSTNEICEILDVSPNNLWVILHRGRAKLRQLLEAEWFRGTNPAPPEKNKDSRRESAQVPVSSEFSYRAVAA